MAEVRKTTLVTGGTRGIGSVIVEVLRDRGDRVITVSRRKMSDKNHISVDLSLPEDISRLSKKVASETIHNLVFCHRYRGDNWRKACQVSLNAIYDVIENIRKQFAPVSSIVLIGSSASRYIFEEQPFTYHAAQAALENLARYVAVLLGPQGITCNCVLPGGTLVKPENSDFFTEENSVTELLEDIRPIGRIGDAKDVAYLVEFLCSDKASFISGQTIFVDGGLHVVSQESLARRLKGMRHPNVRTNHLSEK